MEKCYFYCDLSLGNLLHIEIAMENRNFILYLQTNFENKEDVKLTILNYRSISDGLSFLLFPRVVNLYRMNRHLIRTSLNCGNFLSQTKMPKKRFFPETSFFGSIFILFLSFSDTFDWLLLWYLIKFISDYDLRGKSGAKSSKRVNLLNGNTFVNV